MEKSAKVVIIGAGIVGCSAAYHLTNLGWKDMVVIDQGPNPNFGGSSTHAPGGMFLTNPSKLMTELAQYGAHFYADLEYKGVKGAELTGGVELARTPERLAELRRRCVIGHSWGLEGVMLTPEQCREKVPMLDPSTVLGGFFVHDDGTGRPIVCVQALAEYAEKSGSTKFYDNVMVTDIEKSGGHVQAVITDKGRIECEYVLCCAGFWGPNIGEMTGQPIPLQPGEHNFIITSELKSMEFAGDKDITLPLIREQDHSHYYRQFGKAMGVGNYFHKPLPVSSKDILSPADAPEMPSMLDFTEEHFRDCWESATTIFPSFKSENPTFVKKFNGIFSFTPDGGSILGESKKLKGLWIAEAVWYTHAAGFAKIIAEWMDAGEPQQDVHEADLNRFYEHGYSPKFIHNKSMEQYRIIYDVNHPKKQLHTSRNIARSPIFDKQQNHGAVFFDTFGYERAHWYNSNAKYLKPTLATRRPWQDYNWSPVEEVEAFHSRNKAALYDLSAFRIIEISGPQALAFLQYNSCSNLDTKIGRITYTHILTAWGGIKCDVTIARMDRDLFWVVTGVGAGGHDLATLEARAEGKVGLYIRDISDSFGCLGVWGPKAKELVAPICDHSVDIKDFPFFNWRKTFIEEIPVYMFRISYIGESGWEIYTASQYVGALWEKLEESGKTFGLIPAGGGAFDSLRIEKGYRSWGGDMGPNETPFHEIGRASCRERVYAPV